MSQVPLLLISDAVTSPTGLARITRELAVRIHANLSETFDLAVAGYGGTYSQEFKFAQYPLTQIENWSLPQLPKIWHDHAGDRKGIILFIWNQSWLQWFTHPEQLPDGDLKRFLQSGRFEKWLYCPIDAEGPGGKLVASQGEILKGFDRVLAYTQFGEDVIRASWPEKGTEKEFAVKNSVTHLPHGTDETVFYPRDRKEARACFIEKVAQKGKGLILDDVTLLGICATNTQRKDWGLAFEVCGELLKRGVDVGLWAHTDAFTKGQCWDLKALSKSFGMENRTIFTNSHLDDEAMAWGHAATDVTLGIGSGEGWGLVHSASLACGIPCLTGDYAGAAEFTPKEFKIKPAAYRYEGYYCNKRPVFWASSWSDRVMEVVKNQESPRVSLLDPKYLWKNCWEDWSRWLLEGLNG